MPASLLPDTAAGGCCRLRSGATAPFANRNHQTIPVGGKCLARDADTNLLEGRWRRLSAMNVRYTTQIERNTSRVRSTSTLSAQAKRVTKSSSSCAAPRRWLRHSSALPSGRSGARSNLAYHQRYGLAGMGSRPRHGCFIYAGASVFPWEHVRALFQFPIQDVVETVHGGHPCGAPPLRNCDILAPPLSIEKACSQRHRQKGEKP